MRRLDRQNIVITRIRWPKDLAQELLTTVKAGDSIEYDATVTTIRMLNVIRARLYQKYRIHIITVPETNKVRAFAERWSEKHWRAAVLAGSGLAALPSNVLDFERGMLRHRVAGRRRLSKAG